MKIAILHSGDLNTVSPGGISQYIEKVIKENKDRNEIYVFGTIKSDSKFKLFYEYDRYIDNCRYKFIPISNDAKRPLSIYYFISLVKHMKLFSNIDIIYAQRMEYVIPFYFVNKKIIFAIHGSGKYAVKFWGRFIGFFYEILEKMAIRRADKVIVLLNRKEYGVPYYKNKFKKYKNKFIYGKVPIDIGVFRKIDKSVCRSKYGYNIEDNIIIYFGRLEDRPKGVLLFPEIAEKLKKNVINLKWIIIGNGNDEEALIKKIELNKLENMFTLFGYIEHGTRLTELINCADISIISSSFEGICMSALESLACSVPVIANDVGDIGEYINNNENGYIISSSDQNILVNNMVQKLQKFFNNKDLVKTNKVYMKYESKTVVNELFKLFNEVLKSK